MKINIILILLLVLNIGACSKEGIESSFSRKADEPAGVSRQRFYDFEHGKNLTTEQEYELEVYVKGYIKKIDTYCEKVAVSIIPELKENLLGEYLLEDEKGNKEEKGTIFESSIRFLIIPREDDLYYFTISASPSSKIYVSKEGDIYFSSPFRGYFKQIKNIEGKIYIYYLDGDTWHLDEIHKGGKYFYKKYLLKPEAIY